MENVKILYIIKKMISNLLLELKIITIILLKLLVIIFCKVINILGWVLEIPFIPIYFILMLLISACIDNGVYTIFRFGFHRNTCGYDSIFRLFYNYAFGEGFQKAFFITEYKKLKEELSKSNDIESQQQLLISSEEPKTKAYEQRLNR
jgi:hypothetical protein